MKFLNTILFSVAMLLGVTAYAGQQGKIIILNGYFFKELPSAVKNSQTPADIQMFTIETPEGSKAICLYSPSIILSDESLQHAIPVDSVKEGVELLRRYNERNDGKGISLGICADTPEIEVGQQFPAFAATDIDGKTWTDADVNGKVMVLNLWFTGCGPCRAEMPELSTWKDEMPDVMFFSSTYETPEVARQVLDKGTFNWIPLVNDRQFKEWIGGYGYPLTIVVDRNGKIAAFEYGASPEQRATLKKAIETIR